MPHIRIRATSEENVGKLSKELTPILAKETETPENYFTYEYVHTSFYSEGSKNPGDVFVEVLWFDRGQNIQDKVAGVITKAVHDLHGPGDIVVVFTPLAKECYYENGQHF